MPSRKALIRKPAHVLVASGIHKQILDGDLSPGAQLRQDAFAKDYGVSQATVREAFRSLEAGRLITSHSNRGAFVRKVTAEDVIEVYDLREALETMALAKSFSGLDARALDRAQTILEKSEQSEAFSFVSAENRKFHEVFYSFRTDSLTKSLIDQCFGGITPSWMEFIRECPKQAQAYEKASSQEHWDFLNACRAGNLAKASLLLGQHLQHACRILTSFLSEGSGHHQTPGSSATT